MGGITSRTETSRQTSMSDIASTNRTDEEYEYQEDCEALPPGLENEGNTCFLNGVLQALAAIPPGVHFLYRSANMNAAALRFHKREDTKKASNHAFVDVQWIHAEEKASSRLTLQLARLLCDLNRQSHAKYIYPIRNYLTGTGIFSLVDGQQQDAHELLFGTLWSAISDNELHNAALAHADILRGMIAMQSFEKLGGPDSIGMLQQLNVHEAIPILSARRNAIIRPQRVRLYNARFSESSHLSTPLSQITSYDADDQPVSLNNIWLSASHSRTCSVNSSLSTTSSTSSRWKFRTHNPKHASIHLSQVPHNPFAGTISRRTTCTHCESGDPWRTEKFTCLSLVLPSPFASVMYGVSPATQSENSVTIQQLLRSYFQFERINDWRCDTCHQSGCTRRTRLTRLPEVLCIHLQRNMTGCKNMVRVKFPEHLRMNTLRGAPLSTLKRASQSHTMETQIEDLSKWETENESSLGDDTYVLMSAVQHLGGARGGHYTCFRRKPVSARHIVSKQHNTNLEEISDRLSEASDTWLACNDRNVHTMDASELQDDRVQRGVYLLFYMRVSPSMQTSKPSAQTNPPKWGTSFVASPALNQTLGEIDGALWPTKPDIGDPSSSMCYVFPLPNSESDKQ